MSIYDVLSGDNKVSSKERWTAQKREQRRETYKLIDNICSETMENDDDFRQYLDMQGYFDRYSVNNAILVSVQISKVAQSKDYGSWKQSHVYVDKDTQEVTIPEPRKEYRRNDSSKAIGCNAKVIYDVSQTSAEGRQQSQEQKDMREPVSAMIDASPVSFIPVDDLELPVFYDSSQQTILIRTGLPKEQLFVNMVRGVLAAIFGCRYKEGRDNSDFKSFCIAYTIGPRYDMDTKGFSSDKFPKELEGMGTQAFEGELGSICNVPGETQSDMYENLEKNRPPRPKEQER